MSWQRELILAVALLLLGMAGLPLAIFAVGQQVIGDYASANGDVVDLMLAIWAALGQGHWAAWLLVLSPYVVVGLLRLSGRMLRARPES